MDVVDSLDNEFMDRHRIQRTTDVDYWILEVEHGFTTIVSICE